MHIGIFGTASLFFGLGPVKCLSSCLLPSSFFQNDVQQRYELWIPCLKCTSYLTDKIYLSFVTCYQLIETIVIRDDIFKEYTWERTVRLSFCVQGVIWVSKVMNKLSCGAPRVFVCDWHYIAFNVIIESCSQRVYILHSRGSSVAVAYIFWFQVFDPSFAMRALFSELK